MQRPKNMIVEYVAIFLLIVWWLISIYNDRRITEQTIPEAVEQLQLLLVEEGNLEQENVTKELNLITLSAYNEWAEQEK